MTGVAVKQLDVHETSVSVAWNSQSTRLALHVEAYRPQRIDRTTGRAPSPRRPDGPRDGASSARSAHPIDELHGRTDDPPPIEPRPPGIRRTGRHHARRITTPCCSIRVMLVGCLAMPPSYSRKSPRPSPSAAAVTSMRPEEACPSPSRGASSLNGGPMTLLGRCRLCCTPVADPPTSNGTAPS